MFLCPASVSRVLFRRTLGMGAGLFLYGRGRKRMPRWRSGRRIRGRGLGTDGRTPRSFAAGHSGNAVQDVVSVTLSKEKNNYGRFCQSGVMLVNASGGSQKNQNQEKFVADIVANEKRKVPDSRKNG